MTSGRRPTIGLGYGLELVATAAVCFGLVRTAATSWPGRAQASSPASGGLRVLGGPCLTGLALAGGVGLAVEVLRGRRPASWGLGRWIWSTSAAFLAYNLAAGLVVLAVDRARSARPATPPGLAVSNLLYRATIYTFFGGFGWAIAALCTTAMIAGSPRDPEPDAREWAGRVFASLIVALALAEGFLRASGT